jgi:hypothetical protein
MKILKMSRIATMIGGVAAIAAGLLAGAAPVRAQVSDAPIVVKQGPPKKIWLRATVIHADGVSIMVQDQKNALAVYTFSFAPELREKMQRIVDAGGYQYGDKVAILYQTGQVVALDVRGRPSRPL